MKRHILRLILLALLSIVNWQFSIALAQPRFVPETDIKKVGEVEFQVPKRFSLSFTNKGDKPLLIKEVKASCGCLDVSFPQTPIPAGARDVIDVTYDAKMLGSFYKEVEVLTNASDAPSYIAIQGTVVTEVHDYGKEFPIDLGNVRLITKSVEFGDVNMGDKPTAELRILNTDRTAFRPELMHLPPYLSAKCEPEDIPSGKSGTIQLTLDTEKLNVLGLNQTSIYISRYMGDKISETNAIQVSAILLPSFAGMSEEELAQAPVLSISEPSVVMEPISGKKTVSRTILLANTGKNDLHIHQVQVFGQSLSVSIANKTIRPGKSTKLKIAVSALHLDKNKDKMRVMLITDDPKRAKQYIDVKVKS